MQTVYADIHSELVERCKQGERSAQHDLYKLYARPMYNSAFRLLKNEDDARDIVQDAFLDMFTKLHSFRAESSFGAWFKRIVVNKSLNQLKKRKPWFVEMDGVDIAEEEFPEEPDLQYQVQDVKQALQHLPEGYRLVFDLYMFEDYSHKEIAAEMGITEATSKSQLSRAKASMRKLLTESRN